jgi:ER lumen protein retaining receptor
MMMFYDGAVVVWCSCDECVVSQVLWTYSLVLESLTILPQIVMLQRSGSVENITANYIVALGSYRALYILNWIYRAWSEQDY